MEQAKKAAKKQIFKVSMATSLTIIAIIALTNGIYLGIIGIMGDSFAEFSSKYFDEMSFSLVIQDIIMVIALLVYSKIMKIDIKSHFRKPQMKFSEMFALIITGLGLGQGVSLIVNLLLTLIQTTTGFEVGTVSFIAERNPLSTVFMFLAIAIFAPVLEELFFRAGFFTPLIPHGRFFAVMMTAIVFGLYHMNIPQIPSAMMMGFFFAYVSIESRSIIPAIVGHAFNNTLGAIQYIFIAGLDMDRLSSGDTEYMMANMGKFIPLAIVALIMYTMIFAAIILVIIRFAKRGKNAYKITEQENRVLTNSECFGAYLLNPATIVLMLIVVGMTALTVISGR